MVCELEVSNIGADCICVVLMMKASVWNIFSSCGVDSADVGHGKRKCYGASINRNIRPLLAHIAALNRAWCFLSENVVAAMMGDLAPTFQLVFNLCGHVFSALLLFLCVTSKMVDAA